MFIILINQDSTALDTVITDSLKGYTVPNIISLSATQSALDRISDIDKEITPSAYEFDITEALSQMPYMLHDYGYGQLNLISARGQKPSQTFTFLNGRRMDNPWFGYFNTTKLPVRFLEKITVTGNRAGAEANNINFISKVNHYDRPYSYFSYATGSFGTNIYNIDFTRPITNDFGLYLSGFSFGYDGYRSHSAVRINSFYSSLYYNQFIPLRLDMIYFSNNYDIPGSTPDTIENSGQDRFADVCLVSGLGEHTIAFSYNSDGTDYTSPIFSSVKIKNYGLNTSSLHNLGGLECDYGFTGTRRSIETSSYENQETSSLGLWLKLDKSYKSLIFSISGRTELQNLENLFYMPRFEIIFDIFDSTYFIGSITRGYHTPSLSETYATTVQSYPYYKLSGNRALLPEYYWGQEFTLKRRNFVLNFYNYDYQNFITYIDSQGYNVPKNVHSWQCMGLENYFELPVYAHYYGNGRSMTKIDLGFNGNYLLIGDSLALLPKEVAGAFLSLTKAHERFTFNVTTKERFFGVHQYIAAQEIPSFFVSALEIGIQFITLSVDLKIDNIFDQNYAYLPNYPMAPRSLTFSLKWEFWD